MLVWVATGIGSLSNNCAGLSGQELTLCQAGTTIGAGIGVTFIGMIWFVGFIVLALVAPSCPS